jgi:hypothetical protein
MRRVSKAVAVLALLVTTSVYADNPTDPPEARGIPPIGVTSAEEAPEGWIIPPIGVTLWVWLFSRMIPPIG